MTHVVAASAALVLGPVNLVRTRKGDGWHRSLGYVWIILMYWTAASSFWIRDIFPGRFSPIHALSALTLLTLTLGLLAIRKGRVRAHRVNMFFSYVGLVGAFIGAVVVPVREVPQLVATQPALALAGASAVVAAALGLAWMLRLRAFRAGR
jgi:uncharacterized membrane protein